MSDEKKKPESKVEIVEGPLPWDADAIILHLPSRTRARCEACGSLDVQRVGEHHWMCSVCRNLWP